MDLTVLKGLLSDVAVVITPSTLIAMCWEFETPANKVSTGLVDYQKVTILMK